MAGIVQSIPFPLSGRTTTASASYTLSGQSADYAIGGMPWLSAVSEERPLIRAGAPVRKEQFDNQQIPGEQSLASWWLRSQSTFIGGAGLLYQDPANDNQYGIRYGESVGINPWINGEISLLRQTAQDVANASGERHFVLGYNDGTDRYWSACQVTVTSSDGTTQTAVTWGGGGTIRSITSDGTNYYIADATGIYSGAGAGAGSKLWDTGSSAVLVRWVKGRLMAGIDHEIFELVGGSPPTLPTAKFTHLNTAWTWTDMTEGANAIYASGYAGSQSSIYKFELDGSGDVPTLSSGGVQTALMPHGEIIHSIQGYLGSFVGIGTNRGFRVGQIDENGDVLYGPLLFETDEPVRSIAAFDRFFFAACTDGIEGNSGLYRVDLGQPIEVQGATQTLRFAYATDLQAHVSGDVSSASNFGNSDRMVFGVDSQGSYLEDASVLEETGTLTTGRVRYNTLEPKIFKFVTVRTPVTLAGSVAASVLDPGGAETSIITTSEGSATAIENVLMGAPASAAEWIQLKLTLGRSTEDTTTGGEVHGWQLKAMPGAVRQRLFTIPLLCFDKESNHRTGQVVGREGRTLARLEAFEQMFQKGDAVTFQDLVNDFSYLVVIDDYSFEQQTPPGTNKSAFGGILHVQLRTIADVISA